MIKGTDINQCVLFWCKIKSRQCEFKRGFIRRLLGFVEVYTPLSVNKSCLSFSWITEKTIHQGTNMSVWNLVWI